MVKTMNKLEEAIRKVEEAVKSTADALDVSNARLICTLSSVAVNTVLRELEIQLRREELFNEMASLSSPEFAEAVQMEADAVGPEPEQGAVQMDNDQNECKYYPRDEKGYYDVPDVHEKHCPTCAYRGKCYVDDVHSWPWTTSECVKAGYVHYRPKYSGYDSSIVKLHVCDDVIPNEEFERRRKVSNGVIDLCDLMSPEDKEQLEKMHQGILDSINSRKREAQKQYEMQKEIERLKADNDRLRRSRAHR